MQKTLQTPRLMLRPLITADEPWVTQTVRNPVIFRMVAHIPADQTPEQTLAFIYRAMDRSETGDEIVRLIETEGRPAGLVGLHREAPDAPLVLGYWLHPDVWGRGIATEAAASLLSWADEHAIPKYTVSGYFSDNPASGAVLRRLGYLPCWRGPVFCAGRGEKVDHIYMSRLAG